MTPAEIKKLFPHASASLLRANSAVPLSAVDPQPTQGRPLERLPKRAKACSSSPLKRIGIVLRVYAMRPADVDGWAFKEIIDALVGAQILDGDGWDRLFIAGIHSEKVRSKAEEKTVIEIFYP